VKQLLDGNADTEVKSSTGQTPLHVACEKGFSECVQLLLKRKANIEARDDFDKTPFHYACLYGHSECAKLILLENWDAKANGNQTPLDLAIKCKSKDCILFL